jgi:hypothetical protein
MSRYTETFRMMRKFRKAVVAALHYRNEAYASLPPKPNFPSNIVY